MSDLRGRLELLATAKKPLVVPRGATVRFGRALELCNVHWVNPNDRVDG
jgi:hypothetical protein